MVRSLSSVFSFVALVALTATTFAQCCETTSCDNGSRIGGRARSGRVATWRATRTLLSLVLHPRQRSCCNAHRLIDLPGR